mgnify:CR=1 FL=1
MEEPAQGVEDGQLADGDIEGVEPEGGHGEGGAAQIDRQLPAHQDGVEQGGHGQSHGRDTAQQPHGARRQEGGIAAHQPVQGQGTGEAEVEQQTADGQSRNGRRGEKGQDTQGFRCTELDDPGGGIGDQQILKITKLL